MKKESQNIVERERERKRKSKTTQQKRKHFSAPCPELQPLFHSCERLHELFPRFVDWLLRAAHECEIVNSLGERLVVAGKGPLNHSERFEEHRLGLFVATCRWEEEER